MVFCRNVLIYFTAEHAQAYLEQLAAVMRPSAYLFVGAAESLWPVTDRFDPIRLRDSFVYQRADRVVTSTSRVEHRPPTPVPPPAMEAAGSRPLDGVDGGHQPEADQTRLVAETGRAALTRGDHVAAVVAFRSGRTSPPTTRWPRCTSASRSRPAATRGGPAGVRSGSRGQPAR